MKPLSHWTDELLACDDGGMPDELFDRIVALGERARPRLLEFATSPEWRGASAPGGGWAPSHALEVLAALPPDAAACARLVESIEADPGAVDVDDLVKCLAAAWTVASPLVLAALAATRHPDAARAYAETIACGEPRDGASLAALLDAFRRFPGDVVLSLGEYGDPIALPAIRAALGAHFVGAGSTEDHDEDALSMAWAIEELGGELTADEARKRALAEQRLARRAARRADEDDAEAAFFAPPLPNDPCPCGSGRKFKKCHEGDAAFGGAAPPG
jgi:hypothetical protein